MRDRDAGMNRFGLVILMAALGACTPKHTNMLIFGTDTKVALDVSASPTNAVPALTLGYRREEVALVPLLSNYPTNGDLSMIGAAVKEPSCDVEVNGDNVKCAGAGFPFVGKGSDGAAKNARDAYSTLASFGGTFEAGGEQGKANAKGAIATYFATGIAAQLLAEKGGAQLVASHADAPAPDPAVVETIKAGQTAGREAVETFLKTNASDNAVSADALQKLNTCLKLTGPKKIGDSDKTPAHILTEIDTTFGSGPYPYLAKCLKT